MASHQCVFSYAPLSYPFQQIIKSKRRTLNIFASLNEHSLCESSIFVSYYKNDCNFPIGNKIL